MVRAMKVSEIDVQGEFAGLDEQLSRFEELRGQGEAALRRRAPDVSGWSVEQHLYHIALATDLAFRNVTSLVRGKGRLIQEEGELGDEAAEVLRSCTTRRGAAKAPRMVTPDETVDPAFLKMEQEGNRSALAALRESAGQIPGAPGWIPHQILGPLAAAHWLRFATMHAAHHRAIVEDILGA